MRIMPHAKLMLPSLLLLAHLTGPVQAADSGSPDWPCVQRKVNLITSAQFWDGPQVEDLAGWQDNEAISKLIPVLMSRRVSLDEVAAAIADFAGKEPEATRDQTLKMLFAGLLASANNERNLVINGIERFQQRQRARAQEIERQGVEIHRLKERAAQDEGARGALKLAEDKYNWDVRVFSERQQSLPLACEVPVLIEQRLFALGREIRSHMRD
jgi:hypothetical protein